MIVNPTIPQARFLRLECRFPLFLAGYGCVHPDTRIWTERGLMRIAEITSPVRVLSWNEKNRKFQLSLSGGAFPKGRENLFRVSTRQGEFVATAHHRFFSSDCRYEQVGDALSQSGVSVASPFLLRLIRAFGLKWLPSDEQHSSKTNADYLCRYADEARRYGQQLLKDQATGQVFVPLKGDVRKSSQCCDPDEALRKGGRAVQIPAHIRRGQPSAQTYKSRSIHRTPIPCFCAGDQTSVRLPAHTSVSLRSLLQSARKSAHHHINRLLAFVSRSFHRLHKSAVDSITDLGEESYYDMQVLDTNNYVDEHGFIHHNSGKSYALTVSAINDLFLADDARVAVYSDTYDQLKLNLFPRFEEYLDEAGIRYQSNKSDYTITIGKRELVFRSIDNPRRIIGYEVFRSHVDEIEATGNEVKAEEVWRKIIARNRQRCGEHKNRVSVYTTPDQGYGFTYKKWGQSNNPDYQFVRASTRSNPYNPSDYVSALEADYPAELVRAFVEGEWCNITSGSVYYFDRMKNATDETVISDEPLHIGMDFNVRNMAAVVTNGKGYAVDELIGYLDTPDIIRAIKERYPRNQISVYPDASGGNASSKGASVTDITMLRGAGFTVRVGTHNPPVKDRINIVNKRLETGDLLVNASKCPQLSESLEKQAYNKNGEPDKDSGFDHANDAMGYATAYRFPLINKRTQQIYAR